MQAAVAGVPVAAGVGTAGLRRVVRVRVRMVLLVHPGRVLVVGDIDGVDGAFEARCEQAEHGEDRE